MITKKQIFDKAHLNESSDLARAYFKEAGLKFEDIKISAYYKLSEFIQEEMYPLLADKSYSMVQKLRMHGSIKKDNWGFYLFTDGSYFSKREAVSFYDLKKKDNTIGIGFCGWADGCNRIPFIKGFIKWCDWMRKCVKEEQGVK